MSAVTPTTLVATARLHGNRVLSNLVVSISRLGDEKPSPARSRPNKPAARKKAAE